MSTFRSIIGAALRSLFIFAIATQLTAVVLMAQEVGPDRYKPGYTPEEKKRADGHTVNEGSLMPPGNDNFANAATLAVSGSMAISNADSTGEAGEPIHGAGSAGQINSIWFKHTATANGVMTIRISDTAVLGLTDSVISAYTGTAVNALTPVAESDDYPGLGFHSKISFSVTAGQTYRIAIDGYEGSTGQFIIHFNIGSAALNNNFDNADDLSAAGSTSPSTGVTGSTVGASGEPNEPLHSHNDAETKSIWYRWTSDYSGAVTFSTLGSNYDTTLAVYSGSSLGSLVSQGWNDDFNADRGSVTSQVTFFATAGVTYRIAIDGYGSSVGNALLRWYIYRAESGKRFDFNGDRISDLSIFRPSNGQWWIERSGPNNVVATTFGTGTDRPTPADFTGDGKVDIAFWRPSNGAWFVLRSEDSTYYSVPFGTTGDIPAAGLFERIDSMADKTVFRPPTGTWYINRSTGGGARIEQFGQAGDIPVAADYDGDGETDLAIYRPSNGQWWIKRSSAGVLAVTFGTSTDKPVVGDYTGDGRADAAFFRPSTGEWFILRSNDLSYYAVPFGLSTDIPAPADYDGNGRTDITVFRPSSGTWYINHSFGVVTIRQFGAAGDRPTAASFIP